MNEISAPLRRLSLAQARQTPCFDCASSPCCTHLPLHRFEVRTLADFDHAVYLLNFERIELGIAPNGEWSAFYSQPCRFLDTRNPQNALCTLHGSELQPRICAHYNPYTCWYRKAMGDTPGRDFLRIDRRRLEWIAERMVFDDQRAVVEAPGWQQMSEMCQALALDSGKKEPVSFDAAFDEWLESSASAPGSSPASAARAYADFLNPCEGCGAYCCSTLVFPHGRPTSRANVDYLQFALGFPGVEVGISDGEWQLVVKTRCRHLVDHRCAVFGQPERPSLCSYFDATACSYKVQFGQPRPPGFLRLRLEQFLWFAETIAFAEDGQVQSLPQTQALREHIEACWSEAVSCRGNADSATSSTETHR